MMEADLISMLATSENVGLGVALLAYVVGRHGYLIKGLTSRVESLESKANSAEGTDAAN